MDDTDELQSKELFAHYGAAMFLAANLAIAQVHALTMMQTIESGEASEAAFEEHLAANAALPASQVVELLRPLIGSQAALMDAVIAERTRLAETFFVVHAVDLDSAEGRASMIDEITEAQTMFIEAGERLARHLDGYLATRGISPVAIEEFVSELGAGG
jgi:hypothetical protein